MTSSTAMITTVMTTIIIEEIVVNMNSGVEREANRFVYQIRGFAMADEIATMGEPLRIIIFLNYKFLFYSSHVITGEKMNVIYNSPDVRYNFIFSFSF